MGTPKPIPASVQDALRTGDSVKLRSLASAGGKAAAESRVRNTLARTAAEGHDQYLNDLYDEAVEAFKPADETTHPLDPEEE